GKDKVNHRESIKRTKSIKADPQARQTKNPRSTRVFLFLRLMMYRVVYRMMHRVMMMHHMMVMNRMMHGVMLYRMMLLRAGKAAQTDQKGKCKQNFLHDVLLVL